MELVAPVTRVKEKICYAGNSYKVTLVPGSKLPTVDILRSKADEIVQQGKEDAFYVLDLGDVVQKYEKWHQLIPRVEPFYAVKCNPSPVVIKTLAYLGAGFDCASQDEIDLVLKLGVSPSKIVFANPCKPHSAIRFAASRGVDLMTFDTEVELYKIKQNFSTSCLLLRILPPMHFEKQLDMGIKFGCHFKDVENLLQKAKQLELSVLGISFNVGSGVLEAEAYSAAVQMASRAFEVGESLGFNFSLLDVGGGFLGCTHESKQFEKTAEALNEALEKYFPPERHIRIISEPGTYFVASAYTLAVNIIGKVPESRDRAGPEIDQLSVGDKHTGFKYFLNDGIFGSFLNVVLAKRLQLDFQPLKTPLNPQRFKCSLWGPTCAGMDLIVGETTLPEMTVGDYLCVNNMGAYTISLRSDFNGMPQLEVLIYCAEDIWSRTFPEGNL